MVPLNSIAWCSLGVSTAEPSQALNSLCPSHVGEMQQKTQLNLCQSESASCCLCAIMLAGGRRYAKQDPSEVCCCHTQGRRGGGGEEMCCQHQEALEWHG